MKNKIIGIDLGGTNIRAAQLFDKQLSEVLSVKVSSSGTEKEVLEELFHLTDQLVNDSIEAIGIGVPSVVDVEKGIVYEVQNIKSWKEVQLRKELEERYHVPVFINNDANCFALGEKHFGKGRDFHSFIGLAIGTGIGAGIIINDRLYSGPNCGAGEFGMVNYLDKYYEYYASGQFFENCYDTDGETIYKRAASGNETALKMMEEFGEHLGNAIKMILYTYDPECIILGGSIAKAYPLFQKRLWKQINVFAYPKSLDKFSIRISELENAGVLGAAALCYYN